VELFSCFSPETSRELLLGAALVGMADEGLEVGDEASEAELACLREWSRELDAVALLEAMDEGDEATLAELAIGVFRCSPSLLLAEYTGDHYREVSGYGLGAHTLLVEAR
jgi:hypothetical protein